MKSELTTLCRCDNLKVPKTPFKIYDQWTWKPNTADWEAGLSKRTAEPVWVTNIPRGILRF
jgi:hypothetical protein